MVILKNETPHEYQAAIEPLISFYEDFFAGNS